MHEPRDPARSHAFVLHAEGPEGPLMVRDLATLEAVRLDSVDQLPETLRRWLTRDAAVQDAAAGLSERLPELTGAEARVASLAADGVSNKAIAAALDVRLRTVESHLTSAYSKLGVGSRRELSRLIKERSRQ